MALDLRSSELEHAFIKERISNVEKHFSDISLKFAAYIKRLSQVRDSGDDLAGSISKFATKENLNLSLRKCLIQFTDILKAVQEYRDAQIQRTDVKVVLEFANYKPICKLTKTELKTRLDVRAKEISMKNQLEKTRVKNPTNWQKIAEKEAFRAQDEATHATVELSKRLDNFEQQKLQDIKHTLLEFIKIELMFHAKALELYTSAYNQIKNINVEDDLREFRSHFTSYSTPLVTESVPSISDQAHAQVDNSTGDSNANRNAGQFASMSTPGAMSSLENKTSHFVTSTPKTASSNDKCIAEA